MADCERCGHPFEPHKICGSFTAPEFTHGIEVPVAGWVVCQEDDCVCWSTWSISHPDLPPALVAKIDGYLMTLRREHEDETTGIIDMIYEDGLITGKRWAEESHEYRRTHPDAWRTPDA